MIKYHNPPGSGATGGTTTETTTIGAGAATPGAPQSAAEETCYVD